MKFNQFRVARPSQSLAAIKQFYGPDGLGLPLLFTFEDHAGYDGIVFGIPNEKYQLEFTEFKGHGAPEPCPPPTKDNLLVFYFDERNEYDNIVKRVSSVGTVVEPENPYWKDKVESVTVEDPDKWRITLVFEA
jgi:hypothetical protein